MSYDANQSESISAQLEGARDKQPRELRFLLKSSQEAYDGGKVNNDNPQGHTFKKERDSL